MPASSDDERIPADNRRMPQILKTSNMALDFAKLVLLESYGKAGLQQFQILSSKTWIKCGLFMAARPSLKIHFWRTKLFICMWSRAMPTVSGTSSDGAPALQTKPGSR